MKSIIKAILAITILIAICLFSSEADTLATQLTVSGCSVIVMLAAGWLLGKIADDEPDEAI